MPSIQTKYVIIVAGGAGQRMGSDVPKQYLLLSGRPILMHTLDVFHRYSKDLKIILVLPAGSIGKQKLSGKIKASFIDSNGIGEYPVSWESLCHQYAFTVPHKLVEGGKERFYSVRNGLEAISEDGLVAVHDAVRPLVTSELIELSFREAEKHGAAVPVVPVQETVRKIASGKAAQVDRSELYLIQTPQVFSIKLLKESYRQFYRPSFTDDAAVVEAGGHSVHYFPGQKTNIKVTFPEDLVLAEKILRG